MEPDAWDRLIRRRLAGLSQRHLLRRTRVVRPIDATHVEVDGRHYVNFSGNNYLGFSHHPHIVAAATEALTRHGVGAGASPLVTGRGPAHESAERHLAAWKGTEAALLLPSGYQANLAALQALAAIGGDGDATGEATGKATGVRFLLDKLVHASLVDAIRQVGAPFRVFPHNGLDKLARLLADADGGQTQVVVTESIFSMDGDAADLPGLAALKQHHGFVLLLDEAHASGVYGPAGAGLAAERGLPGLADVTVVTLSKALGGAGGAICASSAFCEAVVNYGRSYIYSTAVAPAVAAAAEAALTVLRDEPERQQRLRRTIGFVRGRLRDAGMRIPDGDSPIVPLMTGSEEAALAAASRLQDSGLWTVAIRPPTVPRGSSRVRITLSSEHTDPEIQSLVATVLGLALPRFQG